MVLFYYSINTIFNAQKGTQSIMSKWGYHLIINAYACELDYVKNQDYIAGFIKELVDEIDMEAYGEPQVVHFGNEHLEGNTAIQLISTSNIVAHFNDIDGSLYFDVFSCKKFSYKDVIALLNKRFFPDHISFKVIERQAVPPNPFRKLVNKVKLFFLQ